MTPRETDADQTPGAGVSLVTGAFGNTGRAIADLLLSRGRRVRTLTTRPSPAGSTIEARPLEFGDPARLAAAFDGVDEFYNTYWMRTGDRSGYERAVAHCIELFEAAVAAGVPQIVHISVLRADEGDRYPYFRAKSRVEAVLRDTGIPHAVIRPAVVFGGESALLDQLARVLRHTPVFPLPGGGAYRVRPVHVDDVARLCVDARVALDGHPVDAVGSERPSFAELVGSVKEAVGSRARLVRAPARAVLLGGAVVGRITGQQLLTAEELYSTMDGLADSDGPATGSRRLSEWLAQSGSRLGRS